MLPSFAGSNQRNSSGADPEFFRHCSGTPLRGSNFTGACYREFSIRVIYAFVARSAVSFLARHIPHVVFIGPQKKMIRTTARRIIAAVQDQQFFWNFAECLSVRKTVGSDKSIAVVTDAPVAIAVQPPSPPPAVVRLPPHMVLVIARWPAKFSAAVSAKNFSPAHDAKMLLHPNSQTAAPL